MSAIRQRTRPSLEVPLHLLGTLGVTTLLVLVITIFAWQTYRGAQDILLQTSTETTRYIRDTLSEKVQRILSPARNQITLLAHSAFSSADTLAQRLEQLPLIVDALTENPITDALYIGYPNGEFILFRPLRSDGVRKTVKAPATASLLVQSISQDAVGAMIGEYRYYDDQSRLLDARFMPNYTYDPRTRPWYQTASRQPGTVLTEPYIFFTTKSVGATLASRSADSAVVVALDLTLESIASELKSISITPSSELALVGPSGQVVAYRDSAKMTALQADGSLRLVTVPELKVPILERAVELLKNDRPRDEAELNGRRWQISTTRITIEGSNAVTMLIAIPEDELFAGARDIVEGQVTLAFLILLVAIPLGWLGTRLLVKPLNRLAKETTAIAAFDFEKDVKVKTVISEVGDLGRSLSRMKVTLRKFLAIGHALGAERDLRPLLDLVLRETIELVESDGGAIYLLHEDSHRLHPEVIRWHDDKLRGPEFHAAPLSLTGVGLEGEIDALLRNGRIGLIERRLGYDELDVMGLRDLVEREQPARMALLVVPLFNRKQEVMGAQILIKARQAEDTAWTLGDRLKELIRAVSGSAGIAIENKQLLQAQKDLMDALIKLIAGAIDAKSSYTGGHCARVPALTKMLAEAACAEQTGPWADFTLSPEEWEAVEIGSWLHDCGKVTTPEYVVDKATKLETIYDRIHEIRMRFEVLKRDAEIAYWRGRLEGGDEGRLKAEMDQAQQQLDEEFAFVASCNEGGEFMEPVKVARIKEIARRTWRRTLSNRIGISYEEKNRMDRTPEPALPVEEALLADRDDHVTPLESRDIIAPDNPWGFHLTLPKYRMNRGEIYNLCIGRGTLTEEERYRINDHISQTIMMLESLPFPKHLRAVPEIAGGHHEKMDGSGYPKRLKRSEMSPVARMMAIADVFEALTAADRPYKKAKKLSEAIKIMAFMKKDNHLDPELLDLFLRRGVWKRYAEQFLQPEQIDQPDIDFVLGMSPAA
ncbi:HD domain-containing phosphohydrolase [Dongia sp.]|jgi:HD-GYP domain-containing protein (c-di-GMP phosphodiesterase class II)/HAMP domain-containing protein|uniref:HD domain-containing phosphohydrolase n=1 Tax=Dongia sp. TaxID=1977262 RepID=UPI0035AF97DF